MEENNQNPADPETDGVPAADIRRLIEEFPLAWVCAGVVKEASLLPLVGVYDEGNRVTELIGHVARRNPLASALAQDASARIRFTGPQGYISPSMVGRRNWGPTWNYAQLQVDAEIHIADEHTASSLEVLIEHVEAGRLEPWSAAELGERYELLTPHIIGFRARVLKQTPRFKLGQGENADDLKTMLENMPDGDLKAWMIHANADRLAVR